jgi:hypothetical protein
MTSRLDARACDGSPTVPVPGTDAEGAALTYRLSARVRPMQTAWARHAPEGLTFFPCRTMDGAR